MPEDRTCRKKAGCLKMWGAIGFVCLIGFFAYKPTLGYFFTGTDTLTLIETASVASYRDLQRVFTTPLMAGTSFVERGKFYRPIAVLSYALDHAIWGLNPFGYHLTDLALHLLVVALAGWLVWFLTRGDLWVAGTAAALFAIHPILVESVPAPALRHDSLAALFLLAALCLLVRTGPGTSPSRRAVVAAVCSYVLALGAKETAIFFPCLVLAYHGVFSEKARVRERFLAAARGSAIFFLATLGYLAWRIHLLGSMGGYPENPVSITNAIAKSMDIVVLYFHDLLYPQDLLNISAVMLQSRFIFLLVILTAGCVLVGIGRRDPSGRTNVRVPCFLAVWLCLPLAVFVLSATFSHRNMYVAVIPFSALLSWVLVNGLRYAREASARNRCESCSEAPPAASLGMMRLNYCCIGFAAAVAVSLMASSPLLRHYPEVADSGKISSLFFKKLGAIVPRLPAEVTVHIYNLPAAIRHYEDETPRAREVGYLNDYSIKSLLNLHYPGNRLRILVHTRSRPERLPRDVSLGTEKRGPRDVRLFVSQVGMRDGPYLASNSPQSRSSHSFMR
ncbi:MAG: hypothetical protein HY914_10365 [Desulfomonile tiedjei]|nr:hypothetical protein [Desulfomonile tiedjei]